MFIILSFLTVKAQQQDTTIYQRCHLANDPPSTDGRGVIFDSCPQLKKGPDAFYKYISSHTRVPKKARADGVQGKVIIAIVVEKNGSLSHIKVARAIGDGCDEEAVRLIKSCPPWTPGVKTAGLSGFFIACRLVLR